MKPFRKTVSDCRMKQVVELRRPGFLDWPSFEDSPNDGISATDTRKASPYKVGDVIQWIDPTRNDEIIITGLICAVFVEYNDHLGEFLCGYRARPQRKDGKFANGYLRVYPGYINRAKEALNAT